MLVAMESKQQIETSSQHTMIYTRWLEFFSETRASAILWWISPIYLKESWSTLAWPFLIRIRRPASNSTMIQRRTLHLTIEPSTSVKMTLFHEVFTDMNSNLSTMHFAIY